MNARMRMFISGLCRCTALAFMVSVPASAVAQEAKPATSDTATFLETEHNVRHEFVQRYPLLDQAKKSIGSQLGQNKAAVGVLTTINRYPDDQKFGLVFAYVMQGKVEANKTIAAPPSYWQRQLAQLMTALPYGDDLAMIYLGQDEARAAQENERAPNRFAVDTLLSFRSLIVGYGIASGEEFDRASPIAKARLILEMFGRMQGDIGLPCPFSIFLLDMEAAQAGDADDPPVAREAVGRLLGKSGADYLHFPDYSREQKSVALKRAYLHLLEQAQKVAEAPSVENLNDYLRFAGMSSNSGSWSVQEETGKLHPFSELMRVTFGDAEIQKFNLQAEGPDKDVNRIAVILLWTQFRLGSSGWMIG